MHRRACLIFIWVPKMFFFLNKGSALGIFKVSLYMDGVDGLCSNVRPGKKSKKVEFEMQPNSAHNVKYPIIPMEAKKYPIKVTAIVKKLGSGDTDAIQKDLYVVVSDYEVYTHDHILSCIV